MQGFFTKGVITMTRKLLALAAATATALTTVTATAGSPAIGAGQTTRVSVTSTGAEANGMSSDPVVSTDGRYVAFTSSATNLAPGDTNRQSDVYLRDRTIGSTELVTVGQSGLAAGGSVTDISADGRYVVFTSSAPDHVPGDTNAVSDVFVRDRSTGVTERVSVDSAEEQSRQNSLDGSISRDGRYVAFTAFGRLVPEDTDSYGSDVYVRDRQTGTTQLVSVKLSGHQGGGQLAVISDNGKYVSFTSKSGKLVKHDTNGTHDVFLRNIAKGSTRRISVSSSGEQALKPSKVSDLSANGRMIAFASDAGSLVKRDKNKRTDVFVHDRVSGDTKIVSVNSREERAAGPSLAPAISADGMFVTFNSPPDLLGGSGGYGQGLYLRDLVAGKTTLLLQGVIWPSAITGNGHGVAFPSYSSNIVPGDTNGSGDVFFHAW
jgi:Tol biopolymer transport system component